MPSNAICVTRYITKNQAPAARTGAAAPRGAACCRLRARRPNDFTPADVWGPAGAGCPLTDRRRNGQPRA